MPCRHIASASGPQQRGDAAIIAAPGLGCQGDDGLDQRILIGRHGRHVTLRVAVPADDPAGVTFREPILLSDPVHRLDHALGLLFACFQADLNAGFITVQNRLSGESLEEYIRPIGGGYVFARPGIARLESCLGDSLPTAV